MNNYDLFNEQQWENKESHLGWVQELLRDFKKELQNQSREKQTPTKVDYALSQLTDHVAETFSYESSKLEQIFQKHPELMTLLNSVSQKNEQQNNNETIDTELLQQEKMLLVDLLHSIVASVNKQIDEEKVSWYTAEAVSFYQKIPLINTLFAFLAKKANIEHI